MILTFEGGRRELVLGENITILINSLKISCMQKVALNV